MSLLSRFLDRLFPPKGLPEETHSIRLGAKGFDVVDGGSTATCPWGDVARIELVKLDLFAFDMICMDLTIDGLDGQVLRLNERMKGWSDLVSDASDRIGGGAIGVGVVRSHRASGLCRKQNHHLRPLSAVSGGGRAVS